MARADLGHTNSLATNKYTNMYIHNLLHKATYNPLLRAAAYCDSIRYPLVGVDTIGFSWLGEEEMMSTSTVALSLAIGDVSII